MGAQSFPFSARASNQKYRNSCKITFQDIEGLLVAVQVIVRRKASTRESSLRNLSNICPFSPSDQ